jgi:glycerol-3-phosphate O-acyltransferase/dihydroxyacetone phosphate acyltransferase
VYSEVIKKLLNNEVLGIFPEGGSHDRTEMLPLKPGACIFVWEC